MNYTFQNGVNPNRKKPQEPHWLKQRADFNMNDS